MTKSTDTDYATWDRERRDAFPIATHWRYQSFHRDHNGVGITCAFWCTGTGRCWIECDEEPRKKIGGSEG